MRLSFILLIFSCVLFSLSNGAVVSYVDNPSCATVAGGCNFLGDIWNSTLSTGDQVIIVSNESITLYLNDSVLLLTSLEFGSSGAPVTIIFSNTTFTATFNSSLVTSLLWGGNSILIAIKSSITADIVTGQNLSLSESTFSASFFSTFELYAESASTILSNYGIILYNAEVHDSAITLVGIYSTIDIATNFYGTNVFFGGDLKVEGSLSLHNSSFANSITLSNSSVAEFHDTSLNLKRLILMSPSYFGFHATNSNSTLYSASVTYLDILNDTIVHLGDNVQAVFIGGFGNNVNITLGDPASPYDWFHVYNLQQISSNSTTNLTINDQSTINSVTPVHVSVYTTSQKSQVITYQLILVPGSTIFGEGSLLIGGGIVDCSGSNISIAAVVWQSGVLLVDTLSTPSLAPYYLYSYSVSGTIIGNVIIESQYAGLGLYNNTWNITGNLALTGGYLNLTVSTISYTTPLVVVGGSVTIKDVTIIATLSRDVEENEKILLVQSQSKSLSTSGTSVKPVHELAQYSLSLSDTTGDGSLYLIVSNKKEEHKSFWTKKNIIIVASAAGGSVLLIIIIAIIIKSRSRNNYQQIRK